ncbi:MAG: hypothetical protein Q9184_005773 [Pyrenodesmia sp. 2 TL-2023]
MDEYGNLQDWAKRTSAAGGAAAAGPKRRVVYGSTEIINAEDFVMGELARLGRILHYSQLFYFFNYILRRSHTSGWSSKPSALPEAITTISTVGASRSSELGEVRLYLELAKPSLTRLKIHSGDGAAQKQAELSKLTHPAHVRGHASSSEFLGLPLSRFLRDDSVPEYNPSPRANSQLPGTRAHLGLKGAEGAFLPNVHLHDVLETREASNEPSHSRLPEASNSECEEQFKQEGPSRSPSVEITYVRKIDVARGPVIRSKARPSIESTAIEPLSAFASTVATNHVGLLTSNSRKTTQTKQNGLAEAPALSISNDISYTPIGSSIPKRPVAADWFTPTPIQERAEPDHHKHARYTTQDIDDLIEEVKAKAKAIDNNHRPATEDKSPSEIGRAPPLGTAPDNGGPIDYLAQVDKCLDSIKGVRTKQESYLQSRKTSKRTVPTGASWSDSKKQNHTIRQQAPASLPSPSLCQPKDSSDVSSPTASGTNTTSPLGATSTPTTPADIQPYQLTTEINAVEDGEVPPTDTRAGLKRRNEQEPSTGPFKRRRGSTTRYDARLIAGTAQTWLGQPMDLQHGRYFGGHRYGLPAVRTTYDSYRPRYN